MTKKKRITASELLAELRTNPEYQARKQAQEEERQKKVAEWRRAEAPLVQELRDVGVYVETVWDLVNMAEPYPEALPILLIHLQRPYPERVREGIARALAVKPAIEYWDILLPMFKDEPATKTAGVKWALGCVIAAAATDDVIDDVIGLIKDPRHGEDRIALIEVLERSKSPRAQDTLKELGADPDLATEVQRTLKRQRE